MADDGVPAMEIRDVVAGIRWQAEHSRRNYAPTTACVVEALVAIMREDTATGQRIASWPGYLLEDAMPLRLAGGFHHLHLTGDDDRLGPIYAGDVTGQPEIDAILCAVTRDHDARLVRWLDGPPQTNEAARSSSIVAGLLWLSGKVGPCFELNELGCSAGANTMINRYAYDLGGVQVGPRDSPVQIAPEWQGPPPPDAPVEIVEIAGCDRAPIDLADPDQAMRLKSYTWPENTARIERLDQVIGLACQEPPNLTKADAPDWVERRLAMPQAGGVCRTFYHSIVWQYIDAAGQARIESAIEAAGRVAPLERPLAWIMLETNRETFSHELTVRYWPGGDRWTLLGEAQAHGAWVKWHGV